MTSGSWPAMAANRLDATAKGSPRRSASICATRRPNSGCVFMPVPTAVPPMAKAWYSRQGVPQRRLGQGPLHLVAATLLP